MTRSMTRGVAFLVLSAGAAAWAGDLSFKVTTDRPEAIYAAGETMTFSIQLLDDGKPVAGRELRWRRRGDDGREDKGAFVSKTEPVTVTTSLEQPGFVRLTVTLYDAEGKPCKNKKGKPFCFDGGAGVAPEKLRTIPEPGDFDAFWAKQKRRLSEVPMAPVLTPIEVGDPKLLGFDVRIGCAGGKPVSGYFVKPKDAAPRSLPAQASFHGYGVGGARLRRDASRLTLDINAHGIANGKPKAFYQALRAGELKGYCFKGNDSPESSYFLGMFLRLMRALEFLKAQPEWDGKNLIVSGGSQGGLQALAAAGLDSQVTFCLANKPWCCDLGGVTLGRQRGWRPGYKPALGYFDPANHVKRTKAFILTDIGLGDYVCPPSGVTAMYNNIPSTNKKLIYMQGATHGYTPRGTRSAWSAFGECLKKAMR